MESPAVSGRSKSGGAATGAPPFKGYEECQNSTIMITAQYVPFYKEF